MKQDYFEIDRVIEDLAKSYAAPCATSWFKVNNIKRPSQEDYRKKVIEFMKHFDRLYQFFIRIIYNQKSLRNMQKVDYEKQSTVLIVEIAKK